MKGIHALLLLSWLVWIGCQQPAPELAPVPQPDLTGLDGSVRDQLTEARGKLDALLKDRGHDEGQDQELANAFGELGQRYQLYELYQAAAVSYENANALQPEDFRWLYYLAVIQEILGHDEKAVAGLNEALRLHPEDGPAQLRLAEIQRRLNLPEQARDSLEKVLAADDTSARAHFLLGQLEATAGEHAKAVDRFERVLELQPTATAVHYALAQSHRRLGQDEKAAKHLTLVGERRDVFVADPLLGKLRELETGAAVHIQRASRLQSTGDFDAAREEYRKAVVLNPELPEAHQGLALMLLQDQDLEGAADHYQKALDLDPDNVGVMIELANVLGNLGRFQEVADVYGRVLAAQPDHVAARFGRATALLLVGRAAESRRLLEDGLEIHHGDVDLSLLLARILAAAPDAEVRDGARALALAQARHREAPTLDSAETIAMALAELGRFEEAVALQSDVLQQIAGQAPPPVVARLRKNLALYRAGQPVRL